MNIFQKPKCWGKNVKVELDSSNCATELDLKNATGVDKFDFAKKTDLTNLKADVINLIMLKVKIYQVI